MSFDVAVERRLGSARISARFVCDEAVVALVGPSGAGKSSILNMVAGLLRPDAGRIVIAGRTLFDAAVGVDLPARERGIGYVFQDERLFPHMDVRANLTYGRRGAGGIGFNAAVEVLGIAHLLDRRPLTLSGGERQRVAIGRALLSGPDVLLLDEPLRALDLPRREELLTVIERLRDAAGLPIVYVSHDEAEVRRIAGTVVRVEAEAA